MVNILTNCTNPKQLKNGKIIPCGNCLICNLKRSAEIAMRASHELITQKGKAQFITLTYDNKNLNREGHRGAKIARTKHGDVGGNLNYRDCQLFFKRLRKMYRNKKIKYIICGEYGDLYNRPHYHAIIYGLEYEEISKNLNKIWGLGRTDISDIEVSQHAIDYVTGYVNKKRMSKTNKIENYLELGRTPPFLKYSKGLGKEWALKNKDKWLKTLKITTKYGETTVPRYYIKLIKRLNSKIIKVKKLYHLKDKKGQKTLNFNNKLTEYRYITIENFESVELQNLYKVIWKQKMEQREKLLNEKHILKSNEYFKIAQMIDKDLELFLLETQKKVELYKKWYEKPEEFRTYWQIINNENIDDYSKEKLNHTKKEMDKTEKLKKAENDFTSDFKKIAKHKEQKILKGIFGQRIKDKQ